MAILVGATLDRAPGPKYCEALGFAELALSDAIPRKATLGRWRSSCPADFRFALRVPANLREPASLDRLAETNEGLEPHLLVIRTGAEITTGLRDRERFRRSIEGIRTRVNTPIVWSPSGLWEPYLAAPFASELDLILGIDAMRDDIPHAKELYISARAVGAQQHFSVATLEELISNILAASCENAYLSIESARSFRQACQAQDIVRQWAGDA